MKKQTPSPPRLTQQEFADHIGLSYRTVSRVFNDHARVRDVTRRFVLSEAKRLGYSHHPAARALRLQKTFTVGLIGANEPSWYWTSIQEAIEYTLRNSGYHMVVCHRPACETASSAEIRFLIDRRVDAYILIPASDEDPDALRELEHEQKPVLLFDRFIPGAPFHYLGTDSRTGSRALAEHVLDLGHRRLAFLGPHGVYTSEERYQGIREAVRERRLSPRSLTRMDTEGWSIRAGEQTFLHHVAGRPHPPSVIFAANDLLAAGVHAAARAAGWRIPRDLSITGYAGEEYGRLISPALTTVRQPVEQLGQRAASIIMDALREPSTPLIREELEDRLLLRDSTAPPAPPA